MKELIIVEAKLLCSLISACPWHEFLLTFPCTFNKKVSLFLAIQEENPKALNPQSDRSNCQICPLFIHTTASSCGIQMSNLASAKHQNLVFWVIVVVKNHIRGTVEFSVQQKTKEVLLCSSLRNKKQVCKHRLQIFCLFCLLHHNVLVLFSQLG